MGMNPAESTPGKPHLDLRFDRHARPRAGQLSLSEVKLFGGGMG